MPHPTRAAGVAPLVLALLAGLPALLGAVGLASPAAAFVDKDCSDFSTQKQAQDFYLANNPGSDPHRLDGSDNDGVVCDTVDVRLANDDQARPDDRHRRHPGRPRVRPEPGAARPLRPAPAVRRPSQ